MRVEPLSALAGALLAALGFAAVAWHYIGTPRRR